MTTPVVSAQILEEVKEFLNRGNREGLKERMFELLEETEFVLPPDWPWIFQKAYIHACLKGDPQSAVWLRTMFDERADTISKIAYKHGFAYGDTLLRRHRRH